jgi:hypothetical protein
MANGSYLQSGNPYFNDALKGQLDQTANQVQSQFSGAGRYGSGANTGVLTNSLGNIRSSALSDQFNRDSQNMLTANGQLDSSRNAGLDRALQATNAMGAQDQQQFQNALTGAGATLQAGGLLDNQAQKQLTDQSQSVLCPGQSRLDPPWHVAAGSSRRRELWHAARAGINSAHSNPSEIDPLIDLHPTRWRLSALLGGLFGGPLIDVLKYLARVG